MIGGIPYDPSSKQREAWTESLTLPGISDLESSLVSELAEYVGKTEEEVRRRCRSATEDLARVWNETSPSTPEKVERFYRDGDLYLYDLTRWHSLTEDDSAALSQVEAAEVAESHHARAALDFGSGIGSLGILLARRGLDVTLAEVNSELRKYSRHRFEKRGLSASFLDPASESVPKDAFDFVSAVDVMEHLPDPESALETLAAALKPGGTLFINLPTGEDPSRPMHLWHDPEKLLAHLGESKLWPERIEGSRLVLRKDPAPEYSLNGGLEVCSGERGGFLVSSRPLLAIRLNRRAFDLLSTLEEGHLTAAELAQKSRASIPEAVNFLEGLAEKRMLLRESPPLPEWPSVSVVVPARGRLEETRACVESLLALDYPADLLEVILVDDASEEPLANALEGLPVRVLRLEENAGQSAARNLAASETSGRILAFTDNDCVVEPGWLKALLPRLYEPSTSIVGGRVVDAPSEGMVAAFESARSPLDMGSSGSRVGPDEAVAYLPTCNLVVFREDMERLGGFTAEMSVGEDVDFVWRAVRAGMEVRYEPTGIVSHRHRSRLGAFLRRRIDYGSSEADLRLRHPEYRRTMHIPLPGVAAMCALFSLPVAWPVSGMLLAPILAALVAEYVIKLRKTKAVGLGIPPRRVFGAVLRRHGAALYHFASNVARYYGLPMIAASLFWPPWLIPAFVLLLIPPFVDHHRLKPGLKLPSFIGLYWLEMTAYQLGVWRGCLKRRTLRPLIPRLRVRA